MKRIVFIRHSKTQFEPEVHNPQWILSEAGQEMARELAADPRIAELGVLYSSDQTKALETAVWLVRPHRLPIRVLHDLTELTSITNKFFENFEETVRAIHEGRLERLNDGESVAEGRERFNRALDEIAEASAGIDTVGVVAHGNILSIFAEQYEDRPSYEIHHSLQMPDIAVFDWEAKRFISKFGEKL